MPPLGVLEEGGSKAIQKIVFLSAFALYCFVDRAHRQREVFSRSLLGVELKASWGEVGLEAQNVLVCALRTNFQGTNFIVACLTYAKIVIFTHLSSVHNPIPFRSK